MPRLTSDLMTILLAALLAVAVLPRTILAATISHQTDAAGDPFEVNHALRCNYRLDGPITPGDADRLAAVLPGEPGGHTTLCLHSPGGSFSEGIEIAKLLKENGIGAWVEPGKSCLSACAVAFMGGSEFAHEVGLRPWRVLSSTARLGFHAPALEVEAPPRGDWPPDIVSTAYDVAIAGLADLVTTFASRSHRTQGYWFDPTLLGAMLATPQDEMLMIDTIGKAGLWGIHVAPAGADIAEVVAEGFGPPDAILAATLCSNTVARKNGLFETADAWEAVYYVADGRAGVKTATLGMDILRCTLTLTENGDFAAVYGFSGDNAGETTAVFSRDAASPAKASLTAIGSSDPLARVCYHETAGAEMWSQSCRIRVWAENGRVHHDFALDDGSSKRLTFKLAGYQNAMELDGASAHSEIRPTPRGLALCTKLHDSAAPRFCYRMPLD